MTVVISNRCISVLCKVIVENIVNNVITAAVLQVDIIAI